MRRDRWRKFRWFAVVSVLALLLAGCGGDDTGGETGDQESPADGGATETSGEEASGEPIKVGFLVDETGPLAAYGFAHNTVGEAAVQKINDEGGVCGQPIELVIADTESDPSAAAPKARRLVESDDVDFLMGSNTSAVVLAVTPIAQELQTVYFPTAGGALLTEEGKGNRYVFDFNTNVKQEVLGATNFITEELDATKWVSVVLDYAWGWDQEQSFAEAAPEAGLEVLNQVRVPIGTGNWLASLQGQIPDDAEGIFFANFGTDFLGFLDAVQTMRPDIELVGANYVLSGQDIGGLGEAAEGMHVITGYPQFADAMGTDADSEYRQAIQMDDRGIHEPSGDHLVPSYQVSTWETLYAIKQISEEIGCWQGREQSTADFITTLEGYEFEEGVAHPSGAKHFRPEDHLSVRQAWIERVSEGSLEVAYEIPSDAMVYEATVNYPEQNPLE